MKRFVLLSGLLLSLMSEAGHTFYSKWDESAKKLCAKAVVRITTPYKIKPNSLALIEERDDRPGEFHNVVFDNLSPDETATMATRFPSLATFAQVVATQRGTAQEPLAAYFPDVVREPLLLRKPLPTEDIFPNCFGAAMGWFGIGNRWFSLDDDDFDSILRSRFKRVAEGKTLQPETVIVWRFARDKRALHTAILLDQDIVWHRGGSNPAAFTTFGKAINTYCGRNGDKNDALIEFYRLKKPKQ